MYRRNSTIEVQHQHIKHRHRHKTRHIKCIYLLRDKSCASHHTINEILPYMYHYLLRKVPRPLLISISLRLRFLLEWLYKGDKYTDPINNRSYRSFLPYGRTRGSKRGSALSPGTFSLERHRLMWLYLQQETDFFIRQSRILHIAPEQCFYKRFRILQPDYTTADYNSPIADIHFDLHQAPFPDNDFDIIFCSHVLEHVQDDQRCMQELYRMLRPGGWALLQVPVDYSRDCTLQDDRYNTDTLREQHYWQKDHLRLYGRDYPDRLRRAGFSVEENDLASRMDSGLITRYGIDRNEIIYIARKPGTRTPPPASHPR